MNNIYLPLLLLSFILLLCSCKKDTMECVKVKYKDGYCPRTGAVLVNIESDNGKTNLIALLNVPEAFRVRDKVFYVTYHYDAAQDIVEEKLCPALYGIHKIFVSDAVSETDCNN
jgi:hypothetical protein